MDDEVLGIGTRIASVGLQIDTGEDIDGLIGPFYYDIKSEARDSVLSMAIDDVGIEGSSEDPSNVASRQSSMAIRPARIRRRGRRLSTDLPASARTVTPPLESNQSVKNEEGVGGDQDDDQEMEGDGMDGWEEEGEEEVDELALDEKSEQKVSLFFESASPTWERLRDWRLLPCYLKAG